MFWAARALRYQIRFRLRLNLLKVRRDGDWSLQLLTMNEEFLVNPINGSDGAEKLLKLEHLELYSTKSGGGGHLDPLLLIWPKKAGKWTFWRET